MAQIIWADTAITDLENIADYISLSNPAAAKALVQSLLNKIERLERFPLSGKIPTEIPELEYREIIAPPCRVFYRLADETVFIVHICREERDLRKLLAAQLE
ncbi:MAG: type II toxin-antitoxin system RelE/ParE family toxin [Oceanospirillaceae bacterium]|nr:type II toxin-antitoxin system RelE/ParE family toxin [Oceanospirillaceae bacterium]MCP5334608.1 type II toxin-antitoxin system RelE/ParE family toxin [Oceanospirillaceae bacterium]